MKMNRENIQKWVDALRSGEYKQGFGYLNQADKRGESRYCCLGVACEVAIRNGLQLDKSDSMDGCRKVRTTNGGSSFHRYYYNNHSCDLPYAVARWLGIDRDMQFHYQNSFQGFVGLNDGLELSFSEIADLIEERLLDGENE